MNHTNCAAGNISLIILGTLAIVSVGYCIYLAGVQYGISKNNGHEGSR